MAYPYKVDLAYGSVDKIIQVTLSDLFLRCAGSDLRLFNTPIFVFSALNTTFNLKPKTGRIGVSTILKEHGKVRAIDKKSMYFRVIFIIELI